ncbi:MAG TPA: hypothetical protein VGO35_12685 [Gammaproteobacteria bacterium]|jgi:hypothetical protein|nr:hypothetical protein [Gammaproteobacteria bacterium]
MAEFTVRGPFKVSVQKRPTGARVLNVEGFWESSKELPRLRNRFGVYVFAIKPPRTSVSWPYYVGQATKTFEREVFTDRNLLRYERALNGFKKGSGMVFLLEHPPTKCNHKHISEIEDYLIMMGFAVNEDIENDRGAKLPDWVIRGIIRGKVRNPSHSARALAKMFEIKGRQGV